MTPLTSGNHEASKPEQTHHNAPRLQAPVVRGVREAVEIVKAAGTGDQCIPDAVQFAEFAVIAEKGGVRTLWHARGTAQHDPVVLPHHRLCR